MRQDITKRLLPAILVSLVLVLASTVLPVAAADPRVLASWSASGPGIAIHGDEVYVTEWDQCRVRVFNATGGFLREWGTEGSGDGQFIRPFAIAAGPDGTVYVTDWVNNRVQAFNATGGFLAKWGGTGTENGQFNYPTGVAVDAAGNVYVADNGNHRVQKFNATGGFLAKWGRNGGDGTYGSGDGQFFFPMDIAVGPGGAVCVADSSNHRVQVFDENGGFLAKWGTLGAGDGQFNSPYGIAVDGAGNVYVSELVNHRVQVFDATGGFLAKWGTSGTEPGQFYQPEKMAFDSAGQVYVNDKQRVQAFAAPVLARFSANVTGGSAPLAVRFTDGSTNGPTTWSWAFGDGATADVRNPVHVYASPGTYTVNLTAVYGAETDTRTKPGFITVVQPVPGAPAAPTDTDGDGLYDDVNGNDRADFADVVLYFNQMTWIDGNQPVSAFDYNANGRIDFADVVWLFNRL